MVNLDIMADQGNRNPIPSLLLWARRIFPYTVFFVGAVLGSAAVIRVFLAPQSQGTIYATMPPESQLHELAWFGVSLLLYWLSFGLLERNERSWKVYQAAGSALTGALGLGIAIMTGSDFLRWLMIKQPFSFETGTPLFTTGLALIVWCVALLVNNGGACFLWQLAILPISLYTFWWWKDQVAAALHADQLYLVVFSALYFTASMGVLLLMSQLVYRRTRPREKKQLQGFQLARTFPSKYHELFARGRFCELFEVTCADSCPLATAIVAKYQKRRVQYRLYPDILEPFEKAYAILVTPQKRELCKMAHEIMRLKEKQLGPNRYADAEVYLWNTLWDRLQDGEYMGDPQKALRDKNQLLKEIDPHGGY